MKENNEFDILIPVFNENETIIKTLKNILSAVKYNYNIFQSLNDCFFFIKYWN